MKKTIITILGALFVYGFIPAQCFFLARAKMSIVSCFMSPSYYSIFYVLLIIYLGYNTTTMFFSKHAISLKTWALPLAALTFIPFLAIYYYICPNYPQITNVGFYFASIFIGMWLWADTKGEEQKNLYAESDYEQLSTLYFRDINEIATPPKELPQNQKELRSDVDIRFLGYKYPDCSKPLLRYVNGEIEFPGAYIITPSPLRDKVALIMKVRKGEPQMPHVYCDGSKNAIMTYDDKRTIGLCDISKEAYRLLSSYESICVYEVELNKMGEKLIRSYFAPITYIAPEQKYNNILGRKVVLNTEEV